MQVGITTDDVALTILAEIRIALDAVFADVLRIHGKHIPGSSGWTAEGLRKQLAILRVEAIVVRYAFHRIDGITFRIDTRGLYGRELVHSGLHRLLRRPVGVVASEIITVRIERYFRRKNNYRFLGEDGVRCPPYDMTVAIKAQTTRAQELSRRKLNETRMET